MFHLPRPLPDATTIPVHRDAVAWSADALSCGRLGRGIAPPLLHRWAGRGGR